MINPDWLPPPAHPALTDDRVDIWRFTQADPSAASTLPQAAAESPSRRWLRQILGAYLGTAPDGLRFARQPGGKPFLADPPRPIEFNLSHTRGLALIAVSAGPAVGIDVERRRPLADPLRLARRILPPAEIDALLRLPAAQQADAFLARWTGMEARQKAWGRGIFAAPVAAEQVSSFVFRPCSDGFAALCVAPPRADIRLQFFDCLPP